MKLKIDFKIVSIVLAVIIIGMLGLWRPWESTEDRKITVTGQAKIEAAPDEFVFYPRFERSGDDAEKSKNELNTFGNDLQTKLKELGVKEEDITFDSSSYDYGYVKPGDGTSSTIMLAATIKTPNQELAQKVQDYLATTDAKGQLTARAQFSDTKRRELEDDARSQAVDDARKKAERTAGDLQTRLGKVIEVKDFNSGSGIGPIFRGATDQAQEDASLPVTPGKDSITFSVEVVFELK